MNRIRLDIRSTHPELEEILAETLAGLALVLSHQPQDTLIWVNDTLVLKITDDVINPPSQLGG